MLKDGNAALRADGVVVDVRDERLHAPKKKAKTKEEELKDLKKEVEMVGFDLVTSSQPLT